MNYSPPGSSAHGISRQEYWSGLSFPTPGDLPNPEIETVTLVSPALAGGFLPQSLLVSPAYIHTYIHDQLYLPEGYRRQCYQLYTLESWITVLFAA